MVQTDGRSGGRSVYGHVITKFSWMGRLLYFLTHGALLGALRPQELRYQTACSKEYYSTYKIIKRADLERSNRLVGQFGGPGPPPDHALTAASNAVVVNSRIQTYLQGEVRQKKLQTEKKNLWNFLSRQWCSGKPRSEADTRIKPNNENCRTRLSAQSIDSVGSCSENRTQHRMELQSTLDNSNLQGKSKKGSSYRESEENRRE